MIMYRIDLNADLGESFGAYRIGNDEELLSVVTSANIACGFHAGDPSVMRQTVKLCLAHGVQIGAHPGLPDLQGFGRRAMRITAQEAYDLTVYQIGALRGFVDAEGGKLAHVKPHGALYNLAAGSRETAVAIAEAVYRVDPALVLYGLSGSELIAAGKRLGLRTASEVFADRTYMPDGSLTPRERPDALIDDAGEAADRVVRMVKDGVVAALDSTLIPLTADTVCIHGDGPHAHAFARSVRAALERTGIAIRASHL